MQTDTVESSDPDMDAGSAEQFAGQAASSEKASPGNGAAADWALGDNVRDGYSSVSDPVAPSDSGRNAT